MRVKSARVAAGLRPVQAERSAAAESRISIFRHAAALVLAALHEIFDESAYARFLIRAQVVPSRNAYREFLHEQADIKARRPRCC